MGVGDSYARSYATVTVTSPSQSGNVAWKTTGSWQVWWKGRSKDKIKVDRMRLVAQDTADWWHLVPGLRRELHRQMRRRAERPRTNDQKRLDLMLEQACDTAESAFPHFLHRYVTKFKEGPEGMTHLYFSAKTADKTTTELSTITEMIQRACERLEKAIDEEQKRDPDPDEIDIKEAEDTAEIMEKAAFLNRKMEAEELEDELEMKGPRPKPKPSTVQKAFGAMHMSTPSFMTDSKSKLRAMNKAIATNGHLYTQGRGRKPGDGNGRPDPTSSRIQDFGRHGRIGPMPVQMVINLPHEPGYWKSAAATEGKCLLDQQGTVIGTVVAWIEGK